MACGCVLDFPYQSQGSTGQGAKEMARAWMGVVREWETLTGGLNEESSTPGGEQDTKAKMKSFFRKGSTASLTSPTTTMAAEAGKAGEGKGGVGGVQVPAFGAEHGVVVVALLDVLVEMYTAFLSLVPSDPSTSSTQQGRPPSSAGISRESSFASASSSSASTLTAGAASAMTRAEQTLLLDMFVKIDGKIKRGVVGREVKELEGIARRGLGREIRGALAGLGGL
ncbi:hypothetical protein SAICODRAFT_68193 [Saitoella complicata NRRL Y-17804]|nr:uncharacterized protein SAICODRAFT_68193 [Saitoella complicata NRRL Y-17804]ODQ49785.1 hypothetical protein SAICODRAFT_68193 [Saitoella complicata NRRL Y-17804]